MVFLLSVQFFVHSLKLKISIQGKWMVKLLMAPVGFLESNLSALQEFNHTSKGILGFCLGLVA